MRDQSRRQFIKQTGGVAVLSASLSEIARAYMRIQGKPNILFICTDQQFERVLGVCGSPHLKTPHMDAIARSGVRFERSYCTNPWCAPARSSLFTSRMPHETGVPVNGRAIKPSITTLMGPIFRDAGYETAWSGKWHLKTLYPNGKDVIPGFRSLGPVATRGTFSKGTIHQTGDKWDAPFTDEAIAFLKQKHDRPFLLSLQLHNPHDICQIGAFPDLLKRFDLPDDQLPPLPDNLAADPNEPEALTQARAHHSHVPRTVKWTDHDWRRYLKAYYYFTEMVDVQIGRVMDALREARLLESTLIVLTSDHGEGMGAHKWVNKQMLYEEEIRVPMLLSWKGVIDEGAVDNTHLVSGLDVLPTLCDYADIPLHKDMRGKSMRSIIENPKEKGHAFLISELHAKDARALITREYKYIVFGKGERPEMLFDLKNDPGEKRNLAYTDEMREVRQKHLSLLRKWITDTGDTFSPNVAG